MYTELVDSSDFELGLSIVDIEQEQGNTPWLSDLLNVSRTY